MEASAPALWLAAYPETTGYIIPTFLDYFRRTGDETYCERALRMARWEVDVQMSDGAVLAGFLGGLPMPAIFNTGQVLFGWVAAYEETGDAMFLTAATRAADFLVREQDDDGAWRCESSCARPGVHTYDARASWGLLEVARVSREAAYSEAAVRNLDLVLTRQNTRGWFADCCLNDDERPLLHTIAYAAEGLLAAGTILAEPRYVEASRRTADALLAAQRRDGSLAGRFDSAWQPAVDWSCLTGDAQTALVWLRLFASAGEGKYLSAARRSNLFLRTTQDLSASDPGIRGGIKGSHPIWCEYGRLMYPNWAAKFFVDSLVLEQSLVER